MTRAWQRAAVTLAIATAVGCATGRPGQRASQTARADDLARNRAREEQAAAAGLSRVEAAPSVPTLDLRSRATVSLRFAAGASIRDVLRFVAGSAGVNIVFENSFTDASARSAIVLDDVTLEQALDIVVATSNLFYTTLDERTIMVVPESPQNRQRYEALVIRTFRLSHADAAEMAAVLNGVFASQAPQQTRLVVQADKSSNSVSVRGNPLVVALAARVVENNDLPPGEVIVDIEILEVDRMRAKAYGLNLSSFLAGVQFVPNGAGSGSSADSGGFRPGTLLAGVTPADFLLTIPSVVVRFLEADGRTKVLAKPSLRASDGATQTVRFGDEVPVPLTTFQSVSSEGNASALSAVEYRPVGINISVTPRVTGDGEVVLDLEVESSTRAGDVTVEGQNLPSFGTRKVKTRMRMRDGESSLISGLIRDDDRRLIAGVPGVIRVPIVKELFSANLSAVSKTDVVLLVTPHIVRGRGAGAVNRAPLPVKR